MIPLSEGGCPKDPASCPVVTEVGKARGVRITRVKRPPTNLERAELAALLRQQEEDS